MGSILQAAAASELALLGEDSEVGPSLIKPYPYTGHAVAAQKERESKDLV